MGTKKQKPILGFKTLIGMLCRRGIFWLHSCQMKPLITLTKTMLITKSGKMPRLSKKMKFT
jgi:hypothetical protein